MLEIGINEGYRIGQNSKFERTKGGLSFDINMVKGAVASNAMEVLIADELPEDSYAKLFCPGTSYKDRKTGEIVIRKDFDVSRNVRACYKTLWMIFNLYFTKAELDKMFPPSIIYEGVGMTGENSATLFTTQTVVDKMFTSLGTAAIAFIKDNKLDTKEEFRIKMLRQNTERAYPVLTNQPEYGGWIELVSIPLKATKVKFNKWEEANDKDNAIPLAKDATATPPTNEFKGEVEDKIPDGDTNTDNKDTEKLPFD